MKTRYSRFDTGFLELVDDAADFVRNNRYGDFLLSLVPEEVCPCHNGNTIDDCTDNVITKLSVVCPHIGDIITYQHGLHFCQEVYPYRNQNKV
ncbi:MAG: hypothetical protein WBZ36_07780 [Candidatus Nitrosopolaris sp.]